MGTDILLRVDEDRIFTANSTMASIDLQALDAADPLKWARDEFEIPLKSDSGGDGVQSTLPATPARSLTSLMNAR